MIIFLRQNQDGFGATLLMVIVFFVALLLAYATQRIGFQSGSAGDRYVKRIEASTLADACAQEALLHLVKNMLYTTESLKISPTANAKKFCEYSMTNTNPTHSVIQSTGVVDSVEQSYQYAIVLQDGLLYIESKEKIFLP